MLQLSHRNHLFPLLLIWSPPVTVLHRSDSFWLLIDCYWFCFQNRWVHGLLSELSSPPVTGNLMSVELFFCLSFPPTLRCALAITSIPLPGTHFLSSSLDYHLLILSESQEPPVPKMYRVRPAVPSMCSWITLQVVLSLHFHTLCHYRHIFMILFALICELPESRNHLIHLWILGTSCSFWNVVGIW